MQIASFYIVGISIESTNENGQSIKDMGELWSRFYSESISEAIKNKISSEVYSVFTDYESDYTGSYTAIIGHKVNDLDKIPDGLTGKKISGGTYQKFMVKGKMPDAIVNAWKEIWRKDSTLNRAYTTDFEVYGEKSDNGDASKVEIFVAVK